MKVWDSSIETRAPPRFVACQRHPPPPPPPGPQHTYVCLRLQWAGACAPSLANGTAAPSGVQLQHIRDVVLFLNGTVVGSPVDRCTAAGAVARAYCTCFDPLPPPPPPTTTPPTKGAKNCAIGDVMCDFIGGPPTATGLAWL